MTIDFIKHKDISESMLQEICVIKKQHWDYSVKEHIAWMNCNLSDSDTHLILRETESGGITGYMNLVNLDVVVDGKSVKMIGVGNVCVSTNCQGNKYGLLLMKIAEYFLQKRNMNGILLCKEKQIPFYERVRWYRYPYVIKIGKDTFDNVVYMCNEVSSNEIILDRNF